MPLKKKINLFQKKKRGKVIPHSLIELSSAQPPIRLVKRYRYSRSICMVPTGTILVGYFAGMLGATLSKNPSYLLAGPLAGYALGKAGVHAFWAPEIREATKEVGRKLHLMQKTSQKLNQILNDYKYVLIKGNGSILATNRKRFFGIGRLRLETKKILAGEY